MNQSQVIILMGSEGDLAHSKKIKDFVTEFGVGVVIHIGSAHKTPEHLIKVIKGYETALNPKVYITVAGRSNALSGFVDGLVNSPVIACPPLTDNHLSTDIYSSLRMPSGICPAVILDPENAAFLAIKILALSDRELNKKVIEYKKRHAEKIIKEDQVLNQE